MAKIRSFLAVLGGILVHLTLGTLYCWGNINPYVTSYIRKHSSPSSLQYGDTVWVFALAVTGQGMSMFIGGVLQKRIGVRMATLTGCLLQSIGVFISAFAIKYSYYLFLVTYGFMFGVGIGIAYAPPLAVAMKWFPNHKGVANGFIVAGFGGGAFIFDQIQTAYLNPSNIAAVASNSTSNKDKYFVDESVLENVPNMFMLLGGCFAAMQLLGCALLFQAPDVREAKKEERESLMNNTDTEEEPSPSDSQFIASAQLTGMPMVKTRPFITLWFMFLLNALGITFISTLYKTYGESEVVNDDKFLAILGAFAAVFNAVGRILWGLYADRISFKAAMTTLNGAMVVLMGSLYITHIYAAEAGKPLLFIWICLIFLTFSGNFSMFPTATAKTFGTQHVTFNYGLLFTSSAVGGPVGALLSTTLHDSIHSYGIFILTAALSLISFVLGLTFNATRQDGKPI